MKQRGKKVTPPHPLVYGSVAHGAIGNNVVYV